MAFLMRSLLFWEVFNAYTQDFSEKSLFLRTLPVVPIPGLNLKWFMIVWFKMPLCLNSPAIYISCQNIENTHIYIRSFVIKTRIENLHNIIYGTPH